MVDVEAIKLEIVERLKPLNPEKIILFGSYVHEPTPFGQLADLHSDTQPELIRTASRFTFGQFCKFSAGNS